MKITNPEIYKSMFAVELEECIDERIKLNTIVKPKICNAVMRVEKIEGSNVTVKWFEGKVLKKGIFDINELSFVR